MANSQPCEFHDEDATIRLFSPVEEPQPTHNHAQGEQELQLPKHLKKDQQMPSKQQGSDDLVEALLREYDVISENEAIAVSSDSDQMIVGGTIAGGPWTPKNYLRRLKKELLSKFGKHSEADRLSENVQQSEADLNYEDEVKKHRTWKTVGNESNAEEKAEVSSSFVCEETGGR